MEFVAELSVWEIYAIVCGFLGFLGILIGLIAARQRFGIALQVLPLIGVAITHLDNQFYPEVIEKLSHRLSRSGFRLVMFVTHGEADLDPMLDELLGYRLDGIVLASSSLTARLARECLDAHVPVIMFNNIDPATRAPGVTADNAHGGALIARFLLAGEHRRFAVITGREESSASVERHRAFHDTIARAGHRPPVALSGEYEFEGAREATRRLLMRAEAPDAIFCINDHMAFAALQAARELGREPGRDVSIVGFDDVAVSAWPAFALTTYAQPIDAMIAHTAARIVDAIKGKAISTDTERLRGELMVRGSARLPTSRTWANE